ncbi:MAG TPA: response regulator [Polyangiaceae bacterium]|nr:response regulator [Polyangiaceae bacterium]
MSVVHRLLVVSPDAEVGRALAGAFGAELAVTAAASVDEALAHLGARYYPLVLADEALEGRGGVRLLGEVQRRSPSTRRVLVSERNVPDLDALRAAGVVELFLPKPLDPEELRPYVPAAPAGA